MVCDICLRWIDIGRDLSQRSPISLVIENRNPGLVAIVDLMWHNMQEPLGLNEIASRVGYTRRRVERFIQMNVGQSPGRFCHNLRLDHGHNLLCSTNLTLSEIAAACGFELRSQFSRSCRLRFGIPPNRHLDATPQRSRWTASYGERRTRQPETDAPWTDRTSVFRPSWTLETLRRMTGMGSEPSFAAQLSNVRYGPEPSATLRPRISSFCRSPETGQ